MAGFSFGNTVSRTIELIRRTFPSVGLFTLGAILVSSALQFLFYRPMLAQTATGSMAPLAIFTSPAYWLTVLGIFAVYSVVFAGATHGLLLAAEGRQPSLRDCLTGGLAKALPVAGLCLLWLLGVWLGLALLLVPGLILLTMWSASLPVLVGEDCGIIASFGRSRALTKGARIKILALLLLVIVLLYGVNIALFSALYGPFGSQAVLASLSAGASLPAVALSVATGWGFMLLIPAMLAAIYLESRAARFGVEGGELTDVFA